MASSAGANSVAACTGASATADNSVALGAGSVASRDSTVSVESPGSEPIRLSADALFAFNSADLTEEGRESLGQFMQEVLVVSQLQDIRVVGYTDRIGSTKANLRLSKQRAESVQAYLIQGGVPASAIHSEGRGDASPVMQCTHKKRAALIACLSPNRRVELSGSTRQK